MRTGVWFILFLIFSCSNQKKDLPILSYTISDSGEKSYYSITYNIHNFTDQSGTPFSNASLEGKVFIANFFFTSCPSICPPMRLALIDIAETFADGNEFMIISHSIDPKKDTTEVLLNYSETTSIPIEKWKFLRSTVTETKALAEQFMTNFRPNEDGTDFYHSSYVALVDNKQQIRGFYNTLVPEELERLKTDILTLLE